MTDVLGLELQCASHILTREGYCVTCTEVSSRKGVAGNEARVIRVCSLGGNGVELAWSLFKTDVRFAPGQERNAGTENGIEPN